MTNLFFNGAPTPFEGDAVIYLGGHMGRDGSMTPHLKDRDNKATKALGCTLQIWARYPYMTMNLKMQLGDILVGSVLMYASEVWAWGKAAIIDRAEAKMLRRGCGVGPKVSATAIRWLLGRLPIVARLWRQAYRFWAKVVDMGSSRFEHMALQTSWAMYRDLGRGWIQDMISVFVKVGFSAPTDDFLTMQSWTASDIRLGYARFAERVDCYFEEVMREELLATKSKYDFLWSVHPAFGKADLVEVSWKPHLIKSLCKFMLCDHQLEVETMRYGPWVVEKEDRICDFCAHLGGQIPGNETHVLDECLQFCEFRAKTLQSIQRIGVDTPDDSIPKP